MGSKVERVGVHRKCNCNATVTDCTWTDRSATSNPQIRGWSLRSSKQAVLGSLGLSFSWGKRMMGIAIETETETGILNPMCSQNFQGQVTYQLSSSFHATSQEHLCDQGTGAQLQVSDCQAEKRPLPRLLEAVTVSAGGVGWRRQLPACEPDCLPSCAPHRPRWVDHRFYFNLITTTTTTML